jgi:hypothetical protein
MTVYIIGLALLAVAYAARLHLRLYEQRTVSAVFQAIEAVAVENKRELAWLKEDTAKGIKLHYALEAYLALPTIVRVFLSEQRFMDGVEHGYRAAKQMAVNVLERKDTRDIDLD